MLESGTVVSTGPGEVHTLLTGAIERDSAAAQRAAQENPKLRNTSRTIRPMCCVDRLNPQPKLLIDILAISYADNEDDDLMIPDVGDDPIIPYPVLP